MATLRIIAPIEKVIKLDDGGREVWGFATLEVVDKANEIADFEGTKQAFADWSDEISKATGGKSLGNVREMHDKKAVGKVINWEAGEKEVDDGKGGKETVKGIYVGVKVPSTITDTIEKIDEGILNAYSIAGAYAKRWRDVVKSATRYIPKLAELSLVDNPCCPGCTYDAIKADGITGLEAFEPVQKKALTGSYEDLRNRIDAACNCQFAGPFHTYWDGYIVSTFSDHVIVYCYDKGQYFQVPYTDDGSTVTLGDPVEVQQTYIPVETQKIIEAEIAKRAAAKADGDDPDAEGAKDKLKDAAAERAKKYGIAFKDGKGHLTPPKDYPTAESDYGDPVNYAYPTDSEHIKAAVSYFNQDGQMSDGGYTSEEWAKIGARIASAAGEGYSYSDGKIKTPDDKEEKSVEIKGLEALAAAVAALGKAAALTDETKDTKALDAALTSLEEAMKQIKQVRGSESAEKNDPPGDLEKTGARISKDSAIQIAHIVGHATALQKGTTYGPEDHQVTEAAINDNTGAEDEVAAKLAKIFDAAEHQEENLTKAFDGLVEKFNQALDTRLEGMLKAEALSKVEEGMAKVASGIEALEGRIKKIEEQPAGSGPLQNMDMLNPVFKFAPTGEQQPGEVQKMLEDIAKNQDVPESVRKSIAGKLSVLEMHKVFGG
jgi:hypothetical protein